MKKRNKFIIWTALIIFAPWAAAENSTGSFLATFKVTENDCPEVAADYKRKGLDGLSADVGYQRCLVEAEKKYGDESDQVIKKIKGNSGLRDAQNLWTRFRERECQWMASQYDKGKSKRLKKECDIKLLKSRLEYLKQIP